MEMCMVISAYTGGYADMMKKKKKCRLCFIQGSSRIYDYFHAVGLWK